MGDLVTLSIEFVDGGGVDRSAGLYWLSDAGEEQHYVDIQEHATVRQETFPGHCWLVRGTRSHEILLRVEAADQPNVQHHVIRQQPRHDTTDDESEGGTAEAVERSEDVTNEDTETSGTWIGHQDGIEHRFVRQPHRRGTQQITWHEIGPDGEVVAECAQMEVRVLTKWLWWLHAVYEKFATMSHDREYLVMSLLSVAGAYHLDFALPEWLHQATNGRFGPQPLFTLGVLLTLVGAAVAAAVPLTESYVVLCRLDGSRTELKLSLTDGHARDPTNLPGRTNSWFHVCRGTFTVMPHELRKQHGRCRHHLVSLAIIGAAIAKVIHWALSTPGRRAQGLLVVDMDAQ